MVWNVKIVNCLDDVEKGYTQGIVVDIEIIKIVDGLYMKNRIREYENRYWLKNNEVYELHFTQFYDDEIILKFVQDKDDPENYIYVSKLLNVEHDGMLSESIEDAMEQFEDMVVNHIQERISYYEEMLDKFQEEK